MLTQMLPSEYRAVKICCDQLLVVSDILLRNSGDAMLRDRIKAIKDDLYHYLMEEVVVVND